MTSIKSGSTGTLTAARTWLVDRVGGGVANASVISAVIMLALALGIAVRGFHVLSSGFPLNDGGMFYAMAQDLQRNSYALPEYTSYNGGAIPFTYPPAGFYLAALLDDLTPLTLVGVFRLLPLVATVLTVPAFYLLATSMLTNRMAVATAVLAFALVPRSFMWLLMGGGVTRSLGLLFAILALYCMHQLYVHRRRNIIPWATLLCTLTVLSHLETGWFLAFSIALFYLAYGRNRRATIDSAFVAGGTVALTAVWWLQIFDAHGLQPLEAAFGTGGSVFSGGEATNAALLGLLRVTSTSEPLFPLIGVLGALGGLACIASRRFFLPVWWATIILLDVRAFPTFTMIPVALMAGICLSEIILPLLNRHASAAEASRYPRLAASGIIAGLLIFAVASSMLRAPGMGGEAMNLRGLSNEEQAAIRWSREQTPPGSTFLIIPDSAWETAKTAEWFPALTRRISVATVQGTEWLGDGGFERARQIHDHSFGCGYETTTCLERLAEEHGLAFDYVYIRKGDTGQCCSTLLESLSTDGNFRLVYDDAGATIYLREGDTEPAVKAPNGY